MHGRNHGPIFCGLSAPGAPAKHEDQRNRKHQPDTDVAGAHIERRLDAARQRASSTPSVPSGSEPTIAAERIDHRRNAGIGRAHQRQSLLDRPHPRLLQVLIGAGANPNQPSLVRLSIQPGRSPRGTASPGKMIS